MADQPAKDIKEFGISTKLAFDRTRIAYERTMMSWIRTATSLITFGFSIYKFFQIEMGGRQQDQHLIGAREFGIFMISAGLISLLMATVQHRQSMKILRAQHPDMPISLAAALAVIIAILGMLAIILAILRQ